MILFKMSLLETRNSGYENDPRMVPASTHSADHLQQFESYRDWWMPTKLADERRDTILPTNQELRP
jgi:hypothetical protein